MSDPDKQFQTGDVVRLKAGGPPMVVRAVGGDTAYCQWYAGLDLHHATFLLVSLDDINRERRTAGPGCTTAADNASLQAP